MLDVRFMCLTLLLRLFSPALSISYQRPPYDIYLCAKKEGEKKAPLCDDFVCLLAGFRCLPKQEVSVTPGEGGLLWDFPLFASYEPTGLTLRVCTCEEGHNCKWRVIVLGRKNSSSDNACGKMKLCVVWLFKVKLGRRIAGKQFSPHFYLAAQIWGWCVPGMGPRHWE